jgi:hypothetical protein
MIGYNEKRFFAHLSEEKYRDNYSDNSAMKTHTSLPGLEYFYRMGEIIGKIIKKYISESSTEEYSSEYIQHKRF